VRVAAVLALGVCIAGAAATPAGALSIVQHPLPGGAPLIEPEAILESPAGLLVSSVSSPFASVRAGGAGAPLALTPGPSGPSVEHSLTLGPNGDLWYLSSTVVGEHSYAAIFEVTSAGVALRATYPSTSDAPVSMVSAPDGALWIVDSGNGGAIDRFMPGGTIVAHPAPREPLEIVVGPDGALWFTQLWPSIGRISTSGEESEYPLPPGVAPYGLVVGPDRALWFAEGLAGSIGRLSSDGALEQFTVPNPRDVPAGWLGAPAPQHIAVGGDGAIWFTDPGDDSLGRVTLDGQITEYPIPQLPASLEVQAGVSEALPDAIAAGAGGEMWVTEANAKAIAEVNPAGTQSSTATMALPARRGASVARRRARACRARTQATRARSRRRGGARSAPACRARAQQRAR
jgi:streptogramin lyase